MSPRALIVNDDGPPSASSPYVLDLYQQLVSRGWRVNVVLPSSRMYSPTLTVRKVMVCGARSCDELTRRSGTNYSVSFAHVRYYPIRDNFKGTHPDTQLCWSATRRPICAERGEIGEWVLVDGVPSACTNIGLFTGNELFGEAWAGPIDVVISGPNFGRNTGTAFSISSGTLGAALAGSLCDTRSIAISFCHFKQEPPTLEARRQSGPSGVQRSGAPSLTPDAFDALSHLACTHSVRLCEQLHDAWESDNDVQAYSINVPIAETLHEPHVLWTRIWSSRHTQLYPLPNEPDDASRIEPLGIAPKDDSCDDNTPCSYLAFRPNLARAMCPPEPEPGTDVWAITRGDISISRLLASFAQVAAGERPAPTLSS